MIYEDVIKLMRDRNIPHIKIIDAAGKRITELTEFENVEATISWLDENRSMLESHGRIKLIAADDKIKASNWQKPYEWNVTFTGSKQNNDVQHHGRIPQGYISGTEASLLAKFEALQQQIKHDREMNEIRMKLADNDKNDPFKYLPILGIFMDIPDEKLNKALKMAQIGQAMNGKQVGIAGAAEPAQQTTVIKKEMSTEEAAKAAEQINAKIQSVANKIGVDNFAKLLDKLDADADLQKGIVKLVNDDAMLAKVKMFL